MLSAVGIGYILIAVFSFAGIALLPWWVIQTSPDGIITPIYRLFFESRMGIIVYVILVLSLWRFGIWAVEVFFYCYGPRNTRAEPSVPENSIPAGTSDAGASGAPDSGGL